VKGTLYIVSTPIGNLEDITLRALRVLREVDLVAAEDTRHSLKLLNHYGISKPMISYWKEKERVKSGEIVEKLKGGASVALISDAGTPGISDPGAVLIERAIEAGIEVRSVPGPSALVAALSVSGLDTSRFTFVGFLPSAGNQRRLALEDLSLETGTMVFYEAPHRLVKTLAAMSEIFGERKAAVVKELSKVHEKVFRGPLPSVAETMKEMKVAGEYVVLVEGRSFVAPRSNDEALQEIAALMREGVRRKEAAKKIAADYGMSAKELYDRSLREDRGKSLTFRRVET
jgi:16S rRNA (cytidine1402-2'-O)-methyltransferase